MKYYVRSTYTGTDSRLRRAADIAVTILVCAALVFLLFRFVLVPFEVGENSAAELEKGDIVLVDRVSRFVFRLDRGDLLRADLGGGSAFLRLAALEGETYTVRNGKAYIDDSLLDEASYGGSWAPYLNISITVPEGSVLLLPDSRTGVFSLDGYIASYPQIYGKVRFIVSPLNRFALLY